MSDEITRKRDIKETIGAVAYLTALKKAVDEELKVLRPEVDEHFTKLAEEHGLKQAEVQLNGVDVGTITVKRTKGRPWHEWEAAEVTDLDELWHCYQSKEWQDYIDKRTQEWQDENREQLALDYFDETGELLEGMSMVTHRDPGVPEGISGTMLRVDPLKVSRAVTERLPVSMRHLLEGAD